MLVISSGILTKAVFTLAITLGSAPDAPKYYQFDTMEECEQVRPFVEELYLGLGEKEVKTSCEKTFVNEVDLKPLSANMIL